MIKKQYFIIDFDSTFMKKTSFIFGVILILLSFGFILPIYFISDNVDAFNGNKRLYAQYAIFHTKLSFDDSSNHIFSKLRVNTVEEKI